MTTGGNHTNHSQNSQAVVLAMDLQPRLLSSIDHATSIVDSTSILLRTAEILKTPIIVTEQVPEKLGQSVPELLNYVNRYKTITKDSFSAFLCSGFCKEISNLKTEKLIITGIETSICVFLTAIDALRKNIRVTVISDCVGSRRKKDGEDCLQQLRSHGAEVLPLETFLFQNLESSIHPNFREISGLIKTRQ